MAATDLAKDLKNVSEKDRKQIEQAQEMLGPDPATMGFMKNLFWGNFREEMVFPYPQVPADETAACDQLLAALACATGQGLVGITQLTGRPRLLADFVDERQRCLGDRDGHTYGNQQTQDQPYDETGQSATLLAPQVGRFA